MVPHPKYPDQGGGGHKWLVCPKDLDYYAAPLIDGKLDPNRPKQQCLPPKEIVPFDQLVHGAYYSGSPPPLRRVTHMTYVLDTADRFKKALDFARKSESGHILVNIRGTNASGKSSLVRMLMKHLAKTYKSTPFLIDGKEAGYRFRRPGGTDVLVLGKYATACGGLDASFSYPGAADDVIFFLDELAGKGHVVAEGVVAMGSYGIGRLQAFATNQEAKGNHVIFALMDTPLQTCIARCEQRRAEKAAAKGKEAKPLDPANLKSKWESNWKDIGKLRELGLDCRTIPHNDPLPTLLSWLQIQ